MNVLDFEIWPDWATGAIDAICVGAQLCTRDGRRTGNAVVTRRVSDEHGFWEVLTDAGNTIIVNQEEIKELFHSPKWMMDVDSCPGKQYQRGEDDQLKEVEEYLDKHAQWAIVDIEELHEAMRPSPAQTLEQIALMMLDTIEASKQFIPEITDTIRRAIKVTSNE